MSLLVPPRRPARELLDEELAPAEADASLRDIEWVHRHLGGRRVLRGRLSPLFAELGPGPLTLLDVGCGSGHVGRDLVEAPLDGAAPTAFGIDVKVSHLRLAPRGYAVAGDAARLPLASRSVDVVLSTLFLHHFAAEDLALVLAESARVARRAVVAFDLARSRTALAAISVLGPIFFRSRVSIADGPTSVRQAYTPREAREIAQRALPGARIVPAGPFVWQLVWRRA